MFAASHGCLPLLCWTHFDEYENCDLHNYFEVPMLVKNVLESPEDFPVNGGEEIHKPPQSPKKGITKLHSVWEHLKKNTRAQKQTM